MTDDAFAIIAALVVIVGAGLLFRPARIWFSVDLGRKDKDKDKDERGDGDGGGDGGGGGGD